MKLKLLAYTAALSLCLSMQTKAQEQEATMFKEKDLVITAGTGFPDWNRISMRRWYNHNGMNYSRRVSGFGPFVLKADYGVTKFDWGHTLGIGGILGFSKTTVKQEWRDEGWWGPNGAWYRETVTNKDTYTNLVVGARATYHIFTVDKLDCYAALSAGWSIGKHKHTTSHPNFIYSRDAYVNSYFFRSLAVGARYYFSKNIGVYGEAGYDNIAFFQVGIAVKL